MKGRERSIYWHRQTTQCRSICTKTPGATKGVGSRGYNGANGLAPLKKRCGTCEIYFVAKKPVGEREDCPCCGRQLRDKARRKSTNNYWRQVGTD